MIERTNMPINILCKTKYFLSLLFLFFFLLGSHARPLPSALSHRQGETTSTEELNVVSDAKVMQALAINCSTRRQTNLKERLEYAKPTSKDITYGDSTTKVSSKSIPSILLKRSSNGPEQVPQRRLLRQQDLDAFVAYADYRGPRRHPPKNN